MELQWVKEMWLSVACVMVKVMTEGRGERDRVGRQNRRKGIRRGLIV